MRTERLTLQPCADTMLRDTPCLYHEGLPERIVAVRNQWTLLTLVCVIAKMRGHGSLEFQEMRYQRVTGK